MSKVILLADDSVTIQKVIELTFMDGDYEVVAVSNGEEAISRLAEVDPDLVIADVHMPGAGGYEVCQSAKEYKAGIPVLLLVGMFEAYDDAQARAAGADAHLKKPFDSQELLDLVERLQSEASEASSEPAQESQTGSGSPEAQEADEAEDPGDRTSSFDSEELAQGMAQVAAAKKPSSPSSARPTGAVAGQPVWGDFQVDAVPSEEEDSETEEESLPSLIDEQPFGTMAVPSAQVSPAPIAGGGSNSPSERQGEASDDPEPFGSLSRSAEEAEEEDAPEAPLPVALSEEDIDRIARRIVELLGDAPVREVAWEVVPDLAEVVIKNRIRELEDQLEN